MAILEFTVRPATLADCETIAQVHMDSIQSLGSRHYSAEVIDNWGAFRTGERYVQAMANGTLFFIAIVNSSKDEQQIVGFSSYSFVNGKHRTAIYVDSRFARCGIGKALFTAAENEAQKNRAEQIDIDASLGAVPLQSYGL